MYLAPACLSGAFRSSVSAGVYNMNQAGWRKALQFTSGVSPDTMLGCLTTLLCLCRFSRSAFSVPGSPRSPLLLHLLVCVSK